MGLQVDQIAEYREQLKQFGDAPSLRRAGLLYKLASALSDQQQWGEAIDLLKAAADILDQRGARTEKAKSLHKLGACLQAQDRPDWVGAIVAYQQAAALLNDSLHQVDRAKVLYRLANCLLTQPTSDYVNAAQAYRDIAAGLTDKSSKRERLSVLQKLISCLQHQAQPSWEEAGAICRECISLLGDKASGEPLAQLHSTLAFCLQNHMPPLLEESIASYRIAHKHAASMDLLLTVQRNLAICLLASGQLSEAVELLQQSLEIPLAEERRIERIATLRDLGACYETANLANPEKALSHYRQATDLLKDDDAPEVRAGVLSDLAFCLQTQEPEQWDVAAGLYREVLDILNGTDHVRERVVAMYSLAYCLHHSSSPSLETALRHAGDAHALAVQLGDQPLLDKCLEQLQFLEKAAADGQNSTAAAAENLA